MILGLDRHPAARCFVEIDDAVAAMRPKDAPPVCFNAHEFPSEIPPGAIVYNLENVGVQVDPRAFPKHEVWDFSKRNVERWDRHWDRHVKHVPIGYHPSMKRFEMRPWEERDIDVIMTGCLNPRRVHILEALAAKGLVVVHIGPGQAYGAKRDAFLSRAKLALNVLYHEDGVHPVLRSAHCAANGVLMLAEAAPEIPPWVTRRCWYEDLVSEAIGLVREPKFTDEVHFRHSPMRLP